MLFDDFYTNIDRGLLEVKCTRELFPNHRYNSFYCRFVASFQAYADEEGDVAELEDFVVSEIVDDLSILPSEPSEGAFGLSLSLLETPRSVTEVSSDLIKTYVAERRRLGSFNPWRVY